MVVVYVKSAISVHVLTLQIVYIFADSNALFQLSVGRIAVVLERYTIIYLYDMLQI